MIKMEQYGTLTESGALFYDSLAEYKSDLANMKPGRVRITVESDSGPKTKKQAGYYWSALVPHTLIMLRDFLGLAEWLNKTNEDAHEFLKYMFNPVFVPDPLTGERVRLPGSTKKMSKERKEMYIESIILWAGDCGYKMPPPRTKKEKYEFA